MAARRRRHHRCRLVPPLTRRLAVVQTIVLLVAFTMVTVNLLIDALYGWLDPRIRSRDQAAR